MVLHRDPALAGKFINYALIKWADKKDIYFTRSRTYKANENANVEQKNGDVVRGTRSTTATTRPPS